ncbi:hypothetical protein [Streptomyces sp. NPDC047000]|uniref:hypothetical protein n=1 Tax=Streptomyces sp. NPDC047000 TaxID=3155474 RepID=UPI00340D072F
MSEPTPVTEDANVTAAQLQQRATDDYAAAQARREQLSHEDRIHGQQIGGRR